MNAVVLDAMRERVKQMDSLPASPTVVRPLLYCLEQPLEEVEMQKIIELISCEESLVAQCLHMANSPLFGRGRPVETVRGAVVALGMRRLRNLLLSCCLMRLQPKEKWLIDPAAFWEHSFGCGLLSRHFAEKIRFHDPEKAYLAGLLHDIGELVNVIVFPEEFRAATELVFSENLPFYEAEKISPGFTHCDTGYLLAEHWELSEDVTQVILHHHDVEQAKIHTVLVAIVSLSDLLCRMRHLGYGIYEPAQVDFLSDPAWTILTREYPYLSDFDLARFTFELDDFVEGVSKLVASVFRR